jgi:hypothetical protein
MLTQRCGPVRAAQMARGVARKAQAMRMAFVADASVLRAASASLLASGDGDVLAWQLGSRAPANAETALHALLLVVNALSDMLADAYAERRGFAAASGRPMSAPEASHLRDNAAARDALHSFVAIAHSTLMQLRLGSGATYLEAGAAMMEPAGAMMTGVIDSNAARDAYFQSRATGGDAAAWRNTFLMHMTASAALPAREVTLFV